MTHLGLSADEVRTTTRAVRKRFDLRRPVPREVIDECVRIAAQASSGRNGQHWDFVFVEDPRTKAAVADLWREGPARGQAEGGSRPVPTRMSFGSAQWRNIAASLDHLAEHLHEAPVLLIPCLRVDGRAALGSVRGQAGAWGSVLPALWSFMLAARERGLGTAGDDMPPELRAVKRQSCSASRTRQSSRLRSRRPPTRSARVSSRGRAQTTETSPTGISGSRSSDPPQQGDQA